MFTKKRCIHCKQITDSTVQRYIELKSCNAPDGDGHLWEYNIAYKRSFTEKHPFQYTVEVRSYIAHTINEEKWTKLQFLLETNDLFDFTPELIAKLEALGFTVIRKF